MDKLRTEYRIESVITDLSKKGNSTGLVRKFTKTVERIRKTDWFGLGDVSKKTQCSFCAKYWLDGQEKLHVWNVSCAFLRAETQDQKSIRFFFIPCYIVKTDYSRGT